MMSDELKVFEHELFGKIRVIIVNGEPKFNLYDLAFALGYTRPNGKGVLYLRKDKLVNICESLGIVGVTPSVTGKVEDVKITMDADFDSIYIHEESLYDLTFESKVKYARQFRKWVTGEIIPTIRKTGGYVANEDLFINTYLPFADEQTKLLFRTTLDTVRKQNELIAVQQRQIEQQQKEIEHKENVIIGLVDEIDLATKRQILNRVVRNAGAHNIGKRWGELYKQFEMKYHIDLNKRLDTYNRTHKPKLKNKLDYIDKVLNKVPELYEIACKLYENDVKQLVKELYELNGKKL